ncbi:coiled-coil domain-containing protein 60-like isoform X2 [Mizuhopecten yessoensis]|uniref:coiled-coil domain-containing protein 60-like isoform X2 n=1 Tax=Mizuhopecten yessoensis TaxID=6573 RepID=UPI000B457B7E|nr:coiled-coil domain-containing protein 60-like isoform X2 [Mizuhopecten yessoensis]
MPQPALQDPRSYVKAQRLPLPSHVGSRIETRGTSDYRAAQPMRIEVRNENYFRRLEQMKTMGFNAVKHEAYIGIGDPFYLDEKKLILNALGQLEESKDMETSSSSDEDDRESATDAANQKGKGVSAAKFVLRRSRKDLNTLKQEVSHSRSLIRNVRLGHGLFDLIKKEREAKQEEEEKQNKRKAEAMRNEWQPPKTETSSDEESSDEGLLAEEDLTRYMAEFGKPDSDDDDYDDVKGGNTSEDETTEGKGLVQLLSRITQDEDEDEVVISKSIMTTSRPESTKKKKIKMPRPYTPHHTNLSEARDQVSKDSLFRQLCTLNWILDAMKQDSLHNLPPIMSSWKLNDIGGMRSQEQKSREKEFDGRWKDFLSNPGAKIKNQRRNVPGKMGAKRGWLTSKNSTLSHPTGLTTPTTAMGSLRLGASQDTTQEESVPSSRADLDEDDERPHKSLFRFGENHNANTGHRVDETDGHQGRMDDTQTTNSGQRKKEKRSSDMETTIRRKSARLKATEISKSVEKESFRNSQTPRERMSAQTYRAEVNVRPKSSPQLLQFQANRPSVKYGSRVSEWSSTFRELQEDKALTLHDTLENMDRQKMSICQNKFIAINSNQQEHFHRAVRQMRARSAASMYGNPTKEQIQRKKDEAEQSKGNWYSDLLKNIPGELQAKWEYKNIMYKLARYGLNSLARRRSTIIQMEGSGQQHSMLKFIKVLGTLREWEICSPDISAAVEFAREKIIDMSIEDFEAWFQTQFPKVIRPQTAPPRSEKKDEKENTSRDNRSISRSSFTVRNAQSASVKGRNGASSDAKTRNAKSAVYRR